ncbi:MAG: 30S ribosomal protein S6 [Bacteroidota bacterium]|jgi:small subunit ribosomal protein S6
MKRFYECTFIVNPGLDDAQIESTVKMAQDTVAKNGGEILNTEHLGRRRLAYPIAKKHNGYYVILEFEAEGRIVEKVERFLTLDENVMRYLTVMLDQRELEAKRNRAALALQEKEKEMENSGDDRRSSSAAPKPEAAAPKIEATAPKTEDIAPKTEDSAPETEDVAPKTEDIAPKSEDSAPETVTAD